MVASEQNLAVNGRIDRPRLAGGAGSSSTATVDTLLAIARAMVFDSASMVRRSPSTLWSRSRRR